MRTESLCGIVREDTGKAAIKAVVAIGLVVLALVVTLTLPVKAYLVTLFELLRGFGVWGLVMLAFAYVAACILFVPGSVLTLGAGFLAAVLWPENALLAVLAGVVTVSAGSVAGATAAFLLGRTLLRDMIAARIAGNDRFSAMDEAIAKNGRKMVFLLRLSPAFPFNLLNYALGLTKVSLADYVLASWLGMLPGTVLYVYLGTGVTNLAAAASGGVSGGVGKYVMLGVGLAATLVLVVIVTRIARKALKEAVGETSQASGG